MKSKLETIPQNRCGHCGGTGYDPEDVTETMVYIDGDWDVDCEPVPCRRCKGTCKEPMEKVEIK